KLVGTNRIDDVVHRTVNDVLVNRYRLQTIQTPCSVLSLKVPLWVIPTIQQNYVRSTAFPTLVLVKVQTLGTCSHVENENLKLVVLEILLDVSSFTSRQPAIAGDRFCLYSHLFETSEKVSDRTVELSGEDENVLAFCQNHLRHMVGAVI